MKSLSGDALIIITLLGVFCGLLFVHTSDLQNENSVLESQVSGYQNQIPQLEVQIDELENQKDELKDQVKELRTQLATQNYQKRLSDAKQVNITKTYYKYNVVQRQAGSYDYFCVKIKNHASRTVEGLVLIVKHHFVYSDFIYTGNDYYRDDINVGTLEAGSTKHLQVVITERMSPDIIYRQTEVDDIILRWQNEIIDEEHF